MGHEGLIYGLWEELFLVMDNEWHCVVVSLLIVRVFYF